MNLELTCIRCGKRFFRSLANENWRIKAGRSGPYCSGSCSARQDDPRDFPEPAPVPGTRWIRLTRGRFALVDENLFDALSKYGWHWVATGKSTGYASRTLPRDSEGASYERYLHHDVLGLPSHVHVDHRNGDGLDCRRENLRLANKVQNGANRKKFVGRPGRVFTSQYKGVVNRAAHIADKGRPWLARIRVNNGLISLGRFASEREAAAAYDAAALQHFGEFAKLNFPMETAPA